jgi:hypothetical protein
MRGGGPKTADCAPHDPGGRGGVFPVKTNIPYIKVIPDITGLYVERPQAVDRMGV